jgi:hypothetical protein
MAINGTSTDYTGRTRDMHIFQGVDPYATKTVVPEFGKISNFCTGIQKLVQRYTICLLTEMGSQENFPAFGTTLLTTLNNRSLSLNKNDLYPIFNIASAKVIKEFRQFQAKNPGIPDDEKLNTALLEDIIVTNDQVQLNVKIYPISQDAVKFVIPLPK